MEREEEIKSIKAELVLVDKRRIIAYANMDIDAYEGACRAERRLRARLVELETQK